MRTKAQSTSKEGLPFKNMLTQLTLDARVEGKRHEPTLMQLNPINAVSQHLGGMAWAVQEIEMAIAPIISSLAAMEKRLEKIESMQLELKKANDMGQEDIMQRIDDVKADMVQELNRMAL
ncbi:hypothetical protein CJ030_MR8G004283 [Morella rubra]|uniref:Uncharacterized protein n=1 Tax=Morella rubra TaxID=262757 RepID=A0A6A1UPM9_9ROSI|nr:hypothetical protein CJ030_MR8G004283 [Morella rubra]